MVMHIGAGYGMMRACLSVRCTIYVHMNEHADEGRWRPRRSRNQLLTDAAQIGVTPEGQPREVRRRFQQHTIHRRHSDHAIIAHATARVAMAPPNLDILTAPSAQM